jgi:hypothetical protein
MYKYFQPNLPPIGAGLMLQSGAIYLSCLLLLVGWSVLQVMLKIRIEQYLYVKTINGARQYFQEQCAINAKYLVLPRDTKQITFGPGERWGRTYWEAMIVGFTNCMLLAFLAFEGASRFRFVAGYSIAIGVGSFILATYCHGWFVKHQLGTGLQQLAVNDVANQP